MLRQEAHCIESYWSKGEWTDEVIFALLRREWTEAQRPDRARYHVVFKGMNAMKNALYRGLQEKLFCLDKGDGRGCS